MGIKQIGSVRTYGGKSHLAYTVVRDNGTSALRVACSCKGTGNGQMHGGAFHVNQFANLCKPSLKVLASESPIAKFYRSIK